MTNEPKKPAQDEGLRHEHRVDFLDIIQQTLWDMGIKKRSIEIAQVMMSKVFDLHEHLLTTELAAARSGRTGIKGGKE